jgi:hypothetical protein
MDRPVLAEVLAKHLSCRISNRRDATVEADIEVMIDEFLKMVDGSVVVVGMEVEVVVVMVDGTIEVAGTVVEGTEGDNETLFILPFCGGSAGEIMHLLVLSTKPHNIGISRHNAV